MSVSIYQKEQFQKSTLKIIRDKYKDAQLFIMLNRKQPKYSRPQDYRITTVHYVAFKIILKHMLSDMEIVMSIFRTI